MNAPSAKQKRWRTETPVTSLAETIETVEEEEYVLLRFPCFDFFSNVHLCEKHVYTEDASNRGTEDVSVAAARSKTDEISIKSVIQKRSVDAEYEKEKESVLGPPSNRATGARVFDTDSIEFDATELVQNAQHPILYINPRTPAEIVFSGTWEEVTEVDGHTNRAVLHLTQRKKERFSGVSPATAGARGLQDDNTRPSPEIDGPTDPPVDEVVASQNGGASSVVSSLFRHLREGVTADEKREKEQQRRREAEEWVYDKLVVPSRVLVLSRIG